MSRNGQAIERLRNKLANISEALQKGVREAMRAELETTVRRLFSQGLDIDGKPWAPRRKRSGGGLALQSIAGGVSVVLEGDTVAVRISHPKAIFQQGGWKLKKGHTPARLMMPGRRRVGKEWVRAIRRGAERALREAAKAGHA